MLRKDENFDFCLTLRFGRFNSKQIVVSAHSIDIVEANSCFHSKFCNYIEPRRLLIYKSNANCSP